MEKIIKFVKREWAILVLFIVALVLRLMFLSPWLEDWDSVQFALGMNDFSVVDHQPHPPGYPLYILISKLSFLFFNNDGLALTFVSILFGSLAVVPLYLLTLRMFGKTAAVFSSLFFILMPVEWVLSVTPISNIPGLFFVVLLAYFIYVFPETIKKVSILSFMAGVILGVRFTDLPVVAALLWLLFLRNFRTKSAFIIPLFFGLGISVWLIPVILTTGAKEFIEANLVTARYVIRHDVLFGQAFFLTNFILIRAKALWQLFEASYTLPFILIGTIAILSILFRKSSWKQYRYYFLFIWLFSYGVPLAIFYNLELAQYTLPLLPPISIITGYFLASFAKSRTRIMIHIFCLLLIINLYTNAIPQVKLKTQLPPTIAPVFYMKENFSPENTTLVTTFIYRQFQYYAPEFENYYGASNAPQEINTKFVVIDYDGLKKHIQALKDYEFIAHKKFSDPARLFSRLTETNLYLLSKKG